MSAIINKNDALPTKTYKYGFDVEMLKNTICKDLTDEEFNMFIHICAHSGLDPITKQIYAIKRNTKDGARVTFQTSIDGLRLIADRTGRYVPGKEPTFNYDKNGKIISATSYVKVLAKDGSWHEIPGIAYFDEYCPKFNGKPSGMWMTMPHTMISKCAEALALRKAFPAETNKVYTKEEMDQADVIDVTNSTNLTTNDTFHNNDIRRISENESIWLLSQFKDNQQFLDLIYEKYKISDLSQLNTKQFKIIVNRLEQLKNEDNTDRTE